MPQPTPDGEKVVLVDPDQLRALIAAAGLSQPQQAYLEQRWLHQVRWWDQRAWSARRSYFGTRLAVVIGGVLLPFLTVGAVRADIDPWLRQAAAVVSLLVAACAAVEALYGWGGTWLEKRNAAEMLKVEGWLFLHGGGAYRGRTPGDAFPDFVTAVEDQIAREVGRYVENAARAQAQQAAGRGSSDASPSTAVDNGASAAADAGLRDAQVAAAG
jgi:hypothetical protein